MLAFVGNYYPIKIVNGLRLKCDNKDLITIQIWVSNIEKKT